MHGHCHVNTGRAPHRKEENFDHKMVSAWPCTKRGDRQQKYAYKLHHLANFMIKEFECTDDGQQDLREKVLAVAPDAQTGPIIMFTRAEKAFSDQICGDKTIATKIKHLSWMFNTYVAESRRRYDEALSRAFAYSPGDDKECRTKRGVFMEKELGQNNVHPPPKDAAVLPICSTRSVFIHIDMKTLKYWGLLSANDAWWFSDVLRPFSKEANVKCLRNDNSKYASNQQGYLSSLLQSGPDKYS
ncbi:unnamed protein product [Ectocarpus sp. 8 AP-2014]